MNWRSGHSLEISCTGDGRRRHCGPQFTHLALVGYCRRSGAGLNLTSNSRAGNLAKTKTARVSRQSISSRGRKANRKNNHTPLAYDRSHYRKPSSHPSLEKPCLKKTDSELRMPDEDDLTQASSGSNCQCRSLLSRARWFLADLMKSPCSRSNIGGLVALENDSGALRKQNLLVVCFPTAFGRNKLPCVSVSPLTCQLTRAFSSL